jgi:hypothetical protein
MRGEGEQRRIEADAVAVSLEYGALEIIVEQNARNALKQAKASTWPRRKNGIEKPRKKRRKS